MRITLISGANRGLGKEVSRQLLNSGCFVIMTARNLAKAEEACEELLKSEGKKFLDRLMPMQLDVTSEESLQKLQEDLKERNLFHISILINNAGVYLENPRNLGLPNFLDIPVEILRKTLETNLLGAIRLTQVFLPGMIKNEYGRIVNVASGMGRFIELNKFSPYYRISKASLISFTKIASDTCKGLGDILINAVCPGWVQTDMGGAKAIRNVVEGARGITKAALLKKGALSGHLLRDGKIFDWQEPTVGVCS